MSEELIKRSDAIKALNREKSDWNCDYNVPIDNCIKRLNKVKSADRPQGEWIFVEEFMGINRYKCSVCEREELLAHLSNFCPNCGADMREKDNE